MKTLKKYLITVGIGLVGVALILWSKDILSQTAAVDVFHILCDAFCVVGVVLTSAGLLVFSSNEGTFDILVYGFDSFLDMFRRKSTKKYETFYDYRASREDKKIKFGFMVITGLCFLAISMVMLWLYHRYK